MAYQEVKKVSPKTISEFREYDSEVYDIPELAKKRKCTDVGFLIFFIIFILATIGLTGYSTRNTDYNRFLYGYDKCGDTCGSTNRPIEAVNCSGKNMRGKKFMQLKYTIENGSSKIIIVQASADTCNERCNPENQMYFNRCFPKIKVTLNHSSRRLKTFAELIHDLQLSVICIVVMSVVGTVLSLALFPAFRYSAKATVFLILFLHLFILLCFSGYVWYIYIRDLNRTEALVVGIATLVLGFFLSIFICYFCDRYSLMIQLFKETMIAIFRMPLLLLQPLMSLIVILSVSTATIFLCFLVSTNQDLIEWEGTSILEYVISDCGIASLIFLVLLAIWMMAFTNGCQCMVVAGATATNYFTKNKSAIFYAPFVSCGILMRYHLGTVVYGSLVITILMAARIALEFFRNQGKCKKLIVILLDRCIACLQFFVDYLTKRAYIQTAMHGKPLYSSGARAARLLWSNFIDTISLDVVGDFIMFCALTLIILAATAVGIVINYGKSLTHSWTVLLIGAIITGMITYFFLQVITVAIETIFICFCEDKLQNDGMDRPYFMSEELAELVNKAKTASRRRRRAND